MISPKTVLRGIHYQNESVYNFLTLLKLGTAYNSRFAIAAQYIDPGNAVLDFCAGPGHLKEFLPSGCTYQCVEPSPGFCRILKQKNIQNVMADLHHGITGVSLTGISQLSPSPNLSLEGRGRTTAAFGEPSLQRGRQKGTASSDGKQATTEYFRLNADVVTMLISLAQFRKTSLHSLLEGFKQIGKKVVIVEDVLQKKRGESSLAQRSMNYLCSTDYFVPMELFTVSEFESTMKEHGYTCTRHSKRYIAAIYPAGDGHP